MLMIQLSGGLGNQMFQYAFGYSLGIRTKVTPTYFYDPSVNITKREYELSVFGLDLKMATKMEMCSVKYPKNKLERLISKIDPFFKSHYIFESVNTINPQQFSFVTAASDLVFIGYWQDIRYFKQELQSLKKQFRFPKLAKKNLQISRKIASSESVAVHIRRGDYATSKSVQNILCLLDAQYYQYAFSELEMKVRKPHYYVFSNDFEWVRQQFDHLANMTYVDWNNEQSGIEDMHLMSLCKHNIIANSSFSYWSALLKKQQGMVIAPQKWFANMTENTAVRFPSSWNLQ